jgi:RNA polymerase subunit RPABC4/transcription elongation factor Spt4
MCGCMLMHAAMDLQEHQPVIQSALIPGANAIPVSNGQRCTHCGFLLQQGFAFCPNCGMHLRAANCPACGQKVDPGWKACEFCGSPLGEPNESIRGIA